MKLEFKTCCILFASILCCIILFYGKDVWMFKDRSILDISSKYHDFGWLRENSLSTCLFQIKNDSKSSSVDILSVEKSCGCTSASFGKTHLEPGDTTSLTVVIDTTGHQNAISSYLTIHWAVNHSAVENQSQIILTGLISRKLKISPAHCDFGIISQDAATQYAELTINKEDGIQLISWDDIKVESDKQEAHLSLKKDNASNWRLAIQFDPQQLPIGEFKAVVHVSCTCKGIVVPDGYEIPIRASITSNTVAKPASIYLGSISAEEVVKKTITVSSKHDDFDITSIICSNSSFVHAQWSRKSTKEFVIDLRFQSYTLQTESSGQILVNFIDSHRTNRLIIPYIGHLK